MKKLFAAISVLILLSGCGEHETFETISDVYSIPTVAPPIQQLKLTLPDEAATPVMESDRGKLYLCDGYCITVHTTQAGDLGKTIKHATGFDQKDITFFETEEDGVKRYDCVWTAVGEGESQVCRGLILNDGNYHYVVTVMADEEDAGNLSEQWQAILNSVCLVSTG